jgi:pimeloyl-ACP methyl ester carboxylesterase
MATQVSAEPAIEGVALTHRHAEVGEGVRLHYVEAGTGPLVVLLHGFPEFWYGWRHQIPALVGAGFRVVAPDQRGYAGSDKPADWRDYRIEILARDIDRLIAVCGEERALVVGHDWGAAVAWALAMLHPERVERLAILNVPHPRRMLQGLRTFRQLRKSWYMLYFQIPWLPERLEVLSGHQFARRAFAMSTRPGAFSPEDVERYLDGMRSPRDLKGMVDWYRAALRRSPRESERLMRRIDAPTLVIWGERDTALGAELADPEPEWVPDARVVRLPEASHWVQHDDPQRVNELLIEFLRGAL